MGVTQASLKNPAAVAVGVAIVVVFGVLSLTRLPMTLFPHIDKPVITVGSFWRAAAPAEVESEIIEPLEEVLSGLPGLSEMGSFAGSGGGNVYLEFELGTNMQNTLIEVINRLSRLKPLPADAIKPQVVMGQQNDQEKTLTWLYVQKLPTNPNPMDQYRSLVEDAIVSRFEAIDGVASVQLVGFSEKELRITFDPFLAAEHHIIIPEVAQIAGRANDVSGGFVDVGRREYTLRFAGRYAPEDLRELILVWRDGKPVRLGDIADVAIVRSERRNFAIANGQPAIALRIDKNNDANALQVLGEIRATMAELDERLLVKNGLRMSQSFDAGVFIERAITLVTNNVFIGALLAGLVLWWFFRSVRATMLVAIAIRCRCWRRLSYSR